MNLNTLFPAMYKVLNAAFDNNSIKLSIASRSSSSICPVCGKQSHRVHSSYIRTISDLPISKLKVSLSVHSRKFFCDNARCKRRIFSERLHELALPYSRRTCRLNDTIVHLIFALSAQVAAIVIKSIFTEVSPNTVLRIIRKTEINIDSDFTEIGIDDWAYKKRTKYGTLICDIKTHRPIDVLDDRNYSTVATWLKKHNEVKIVSRDRSLTYTKAISDCLPNAVQVADRWHILKNIFDIIRQYIDTHYPRGVKLQNTENLPDILTHIDVITKKKTKLEAESEARLARKIELIKQVKGLHDKYISIREIARSLGLSRVTVTKYVGLESMPEKKVVYRNSIIDPYLITVKEYFPSGMKIRQIYEEIKNLGFSGSERTLRYFTAKIKEGKREQVVKEAIIEQKVLSKDRLLKILCKNEQNLTEIICMSF